MDPDRAGNGDWTGWELHKRLSYRVPLTVLMGWDLAAPIVGMVQGAIDSGESQAGARRFAAGAGRHGQF